VLQYVIIKYTKKEREREKEKENIINYSKYRIKQQFFFVKF